MNDTFIKDLIDLGDRTAFLLGTIMGSLSVLLNEMNPVQIPELHDTYLQLKDLHRQAAMQIHEIYYKDNEKKQND